MGKEMEIEIRNERVVLVGLVTRETPEERTEEYLNELEFLAKTAGGETVKRFIQKLDYANPKTYVGSGKLVEIQEFVSDNDIDIIVFDDELSPSQVRNLERAYLPSDNCLSSSFGFSFWFELILAIIVLYYLYQR